MNILNSELIHSNKLTIIAMMCLGKGVTGFTSDSVIEMSAFLISLRRYPVNNKVQLFLKYKNTKTNLWITLNLKQSSILSESNNSLFKQLCHFKVPNVQPADISHDCKDSKFSLVS